MTDQFIQEIQEDLRREKALKLWKRYGPYVIGVLVAVVIATAAVVGWQQYQQAQRAKEGRLFAEAAALAEDGQQEQAAAAFAALAKEAGSGYADLARLREADARLAAGDRDAAVTALEELAGDSSADKRLAAIARLKAATLMLDTASVADIQGRVQPLIDEGGPWRPLAEELVALAQLKAGDRDAAAQAFARLSDDAEAPAGVRRRAMELAELFGGKSETKGSAEQ